MQCLTNVLKKKDVSDSKSDENFPLEFVSSLLFGFDEQGKWCTKRWRLFVITGFQVFLSLSNYFHRA